jgi:hypothetical protein
MKSIESFVRGGVFLAVTPSFPSGAAFQDPTHVNIISPETHKYFSGDVWARSLGYGFEGEFISLSTGWYDWPGSFIDLAKVKTTAGELKNHGIKIQTSEPKRKFLKRIVPFLISLFDEGVHYLSVIFKRASFRVFRRPSHYMWALRKPH